MTVLHSVDRASIVRSGITLDIAGDIAAQRHHAVCGLHANLAALNTGITVNLVLYVACHLSVGALGLREHPASMARLNANVNVKVTHKGPLILIATPLGQNS